MNLSYIVSAAVDSTFQGFDTVKALLLILMAIVGIATIVVVLMQKSAEANIGAISGNETDTYMGKNKGRSKESILKKVTIALIVVLLLVSVAYFVLELFA